MTQPGSIRLGRSDVKGATVASTAPAADFDAVACGGAEDGSTGGACFAGSGMAGAHDSGPYQGASASIDIA